MLANRVRLILDYIQAMKRGEVPKSHEVLREAKSLTHRLPVLNSDMFQQEYYTVYIYCWLQSNKLCSTFHCRVGKWYWQSFENHNNADQVTRISIINLEPFPKNFQKLKIVKNVQRLSRICKEYWESQDSLKNLKNLINKFFKKNLLGNCEKF